MNASIKALVLAVCVAFALAASTSQARSQYDSITV